MNFLYFLLFLLSLAKATPVALEDSLLENDFKFEGDDSVPVVEDPAFFDLGIRNTETLNKHQKRSGPPYNLTYAVWNVTFERRKGDAWDFKTPGWIYRFPGMYGPKDNP
ncbi:uncharacterized protein FPRO_09013 [Fusarium proliferatum ET1]|uniref:Uncharacterized protein n=1 Tax=Fusarium proliferatum (strain ET1) TaxID=1227346 RepID=A0A1L7W9F9_FUSPR|nr:uncharacterized protein FPRO_09013 [Fusarium proliferatum ET1]CZR49246.1 uncharacterized protein FPRO_09013 [Fusarium proliferatum ET1]